MRVPIVPIGPTVQIARPERFLCPFDPDEPRIRPPSAQLQTLPFNGWFPGGNRRMLGIQRYWYQPDRTQSRR